MTQKLLLHASCLGNHGFIVSHTESFLGPFPRCLYRQACMVSSVAGFQGAMELLTDCVLLPTTALEHQVSSR